MKLLASMTSPYARKLRVIAHELGIAERTVKLHVTALLDALGLEMGQPLLLGDASLRVSKIIVSEPDRGGGFISFSPRVMLNQADVAATGLIQPSSRSTYRLAVAGDAAAVRQFQTWADAAVVALHLPRRNHIRTIHCRLGGAA